MNNLVFSEYKVSGIKCASCVGRIERALSKIDGVINVKTNLLQKTLQIKSSQKISSEIIEKHLQEIGYSIYTTDNVESIFQKLLVTVALPLALGIIFMLFPMLFNWTYKTPQSLSLGITMSVITLITIFFTAKDMIVNGYKGFIHFNFNMYSLILLSIATSWIYSLIVVILNCLSVTDLGHHVYFDSALIIAGFINLGAYFENKAKASVVSSLDQLAELQPDHATKICEDKEEIINANMLKKDDIVKVYPGSRIPADGIIVEGDGHIDESMLSGEATLLHKSVGGKAHAGTINVSGTFNFKVVDIGNKTLLAEIINLVKTSQMIKPKLAIFADKIAAIFVPSVFLVASVAAIIWFVWGGSNHIPQAVTAFMTVLIIACPCSLGLAIPVSLMVGVGMGAKSGILIKDARCLSYFDKLTYIVFDKTGTLTNGRPVQGDHSGEMIKNDAKITIQGLQRLGLKVAMLTGDNERNAIVAANLIGINEVYAGCNPIAKLNKIEELQKRGEIVAFVGDGVNDAPSLAHAHIGISVANSTDIANSSASIVLMHESLHKILSSITLGQKINKNMRQNLFGAFIYNIVAILFATGLFYPCWHVMLDPVIGSIAMSLSSVTVILNALRIKMLKL